MCGCIVCTSADLQTDIPHKIYSSPHVRREISLVNRKTMTKRVREQNSNAYARRHVIMRLKSAGNQDMARFCSISYTNLKYSISLSRQRQRKEKLIHLQYVRGPNTTKEK